MTLIEVLVAVAILGVMVAVLASLYVNMADLGLRATQISDADGVSKYVQGLVGQESVCNTMFRGPDRISLLAWPDVNTPVEVFALRHPDGSMLLEKGQCLNARLCVESMFMRQPHNPPTEGGRSTQPILIDAMAYDSYAAILELQFNNGTVGGVSVGGKIRPRTVALSIARRQSDGVVNKCYWSPQAAPTNRLCNSATHVTPGHECSSSYDPTICSETYFIGGFDANAQPICKCQVTCSSLPPPLPPGPPVPGPPVIIYLPGPGPGPGPSPWGGN